MGIALDRLTPEQLDRFLHLQAIVDRQQDAAAKVRAARAYYDGDHPVMLTERQKEYLGPLLSEGDFEFTHNLVKVVVDVVRERLSVDGFTVNGKDAGDETDSDPDAVVASLLWQWWADWRMNSQQIRLYRRALRDGKSYVMVDYDKENQRPRASLHEVDDYTTGITFHRDPSDANQVLFASRYFYTFDPLRPGATGSERKTVYLPNEIRKYIRDSNAVGTWRPVLDDGDATWPLPWVDRMGKPLGIAVIEFQDPDLGLVGGIIGLQNALNKSWLDLLAAADTAGFPVLAIEYKDKANNPIGVEDDDDILGTDEFRMAPGRALEVFGATVKRIEGANLTEMIQSVWSIVSAMAVVSRLPQHDLKPQQGVDVPSGEALKQLESGLVKKVQERQLAFGQNWADVMLLALRVQAAFGDQPPVLKRTNINVQWTDPNTRQEKAQAEIAQIHKNLGVPNDAVWRQAGYSPEQVARFKQDARLDRAADVANIAGALRSQAVAGQSQTNPARAGAA